MASRPGHDKGGSLTAAPPRNYPGECSPGRQGSTVGDAPHGAFLRHFLAENDTKATPMLHRFGRMRRRIRRSRKSQPAQWLTCSMTVHEVAHGGASRDSRKFILMAEKSPEIRKLPFPDRPRRQIELLCRPVGRSRPPPQAFPLLALSYLAPGPLPLPSSAPPHRPPAPELRAQVGTVSWTLRK
jgi:hypothetical protein